MCSRHFLPSTQKTSGPEHSGMAGNSLGTAEHHQGPLPETIRPYEAKQNLHFFNNCLKSILCCLNFSLF